MQYETVLIARWFALMVGLQVLAWRRQLHVLAALATHAPASVPVVCVASMLRCVDACVFVCVFVCLPVCVLMSVLLCACLVLLLDVSVLLGFALFLHA